MLSHCIICVSLAILAAPANAQSGGFDRPTAGFVFSPGSRTVRPLLGIPGATYIGDAVLNDVSVAWPAPGGKWAFVTTSTHSAFLRGLSDTAPTESAADGIIDAVDRVAWSSDASFAVLYSSSAGRLQRVRLAGGQVSVDNPVDLTPWGEPTTLAIDPSGRQIAFGIAGVGVYRMDGAQSPALLVSLARPAAAAFSDSGRLYAVDAETRRIVEFDAYSNPSDFAIADAVDGATEVAGTTTAEEGEEETRGRTSRAGETGSVVRTEMARRTLRSVSVRMRLLSRERCCGASRRLTPPPSRRRHLLPR